MNKNKEKPTNPNREYSKKGYASNMEQLDVEVKKKNRHNITERKKKKEKKKENKNMSKDQVIESIINAQKKTRISYLKLIMQNNLGENKFMPTHDQCDVLSHPLVKEKIGDLIDYDIWNRCLGIDNLFGHLNNTQQILDDQELRSRKIIQYMLRNKKTKLITMDGHGRFTWVFFNQLRIILLRRNESHRFNEFKIQLGDIVPAVQEWHRLFCPENVEVISNRDDRTCDILELKACDLREDTIVYLNFCGLGSMVKKLMKFIRHMRKNNFALFLSYSARGYLNEKQSIKKSFNQWIQKESDKTIKKLICKRGWFHTYLLEPKNTKDVSKTVDHSKSRLVIERKRKRKPDPRPDPRPEIKKDDDSPPPFKRNRVVKE